LGEPFNSGSTHCWLIESGEKVGQTPVITRRDLVEAPNRIGGFPMKSIKTFALAASILTLTLSAIPRYAAASTNAAPPVVSEYCRAGGSQVPYGAIEIAAEILFSALLP
jgi:hypothetical protein